ncbi:MAG TPA: IPT/TIG domain-containing protein [Plantibacter sp.]|nr:IPT/TIG domain-containing protein [Plantibacter sp.]
MLSVYDAERRGQRSSLPLSGYPRWLEARSSHQEGVFTMIGLLRACLCAFAIVGVTLSGALLGVAPAAIAAAPALVDDSATITSITPDEGPTSGGTVVTLIGTNLLPSIVIVDTEKVTPDFIAPDGTSLRFTTPAHAPGTVDVIVSSFDSSEPVAFTYVAAPTITALSPDSGPQEGGTRVSVSGTGFGTSSVVVIDGADNVIPESISTDGTTLTYLSPTHDPGFVAVTVTTSGGQTGALPFEYIEPDEDATAPPAIVSPGQDEVVTTMTPVIRGTGLPAAIVTVTIDGRDSCTATVASDGLWSCSPAAPLTVGGHVVQATQVGPAGGSAPSPQTSFVIAATSDEGGSGSDEGGSGAGDAGTSELANTGVDLRPVGTLAALMLAVGCALALPRRRIGRG